MLQRCAECGALSSIPRYRCPHCGSRSFTQTSPGQAASISSWTTMPVDGAVHTLLLVAFPDGTRSFGLLADGEQRPVIGAEVELIGDFAVDTGARRLFRLAPPA